MIEANGHTSIDYLRFLHQQGLDCYSQFARKAAPLAVLLTPDLFEDFSYQKISKNKHADLYCVMREQEARGA